MLFGATPLLVIACFLYVVTWQDVVATVVNNLLPVNLKFFVVASLSKTMNRIAGTVIAGVLAKYHEELTVIQLII